MTFFIETATYRSELGPVRVTVLDRVNTWATIQLPSRRIIKVRDLSKLTDFRRRTFS